MRLILDFDDLNQIIALYAHTELQLEACANIEIEGVDNPKSIRVFLEIYHDLQTEC